jgi:predicted phosphoribosyltransferase
MRPVIDRDDSHFTRFRDRLFRDRRDAGRQLAGCLEQYSGQDALVLGIPRVGVPVAAEVAGALGAELDVIVARKLGAPGQPELAMGAVTANGGRFLNEELVRLCGVSESGLRAITEREMREAERREHRFRAGLPAAQIEGRTVIVVDDGLATGATMRASVQSVRSGRPARLIAAVPVGSREACTALRKEADEVVCPHEPDPFWAVGMFYENFEPTEDGDVLDILSRYRAEATRPTS